MLRTSRPPLGSFSLCQALSSPMLTRITSGEGRNSRLAKMNQSSWVKSAREILFSSPPASLTRGGCLRGYLILTFDLTRGRTNAKQEHSSMLLKETLLMNMIHKYFFRCCVCNQWIRGPPCAAGNISSGASPSRTATRSFPTASSSPTLTTDLTATSASRNSWDTLDRSNLNWRG